MSNVIKRRDIKGQKRTKISVLTIDTIWIKTPMV